jgi:xanthine dehydrogenase accessory factor
MNLSLGSAPREAGCRMIVTADGVTGSIGGGNLEFEATARARDLLRAAKPEQQHRPYGLGPALNQCCGGAVTLLFEYLRQGEPEWLRILSRQAGTGTPVVLLSGIDHPAPFKFVLQRAQEQVEALPGEVLERGRQLLSRAGSGIETMETADGQWWLESIRTQRSPLLLFGAGHVGQAVARLLGEMPFDVTWVDQRPGVFPENGVANIRQLGSSKPIEEVFAAPRDSIFVIMTHSHQLDEDLCHAVLTRGDFAWLGLIGSDTKRRRFVQRLQKRGLGEDDLARLVCPIGLSGIRGKQPATIALSLVAQLMHAGDQTTGTNDEC